MATIRMSDVDKTQCNCAKCTVPDHEEDMVACDKCNRWYHYSYAKVDATIKYRKWQCKDCILSTTISDVITVSGKSGSSSRSARIQLQLLRIEEEKKAQEELLAEKQEQERIRQHKALEEQQQLLAEKQEEERRRQEQERIRLEQAFKEKEKLLVEKQEQERIRQEIALKEKEELRRKYLDEKYAALIKATAEESGSVCRFSQMSSSSKVRHWIDNHRKQLAGTNPDVEPVPVRDPTPAGAPTVTDQGEANDGHNQLPVVPVPAQTEHQPKELPKYTGAIPKVAKPPVPVTSTPLMKRQPISFPPPKLSLPQSIPDPVLPKLLLESPPKPQPFPMKPVLPPTKSPVPVRPSDTPRQSHPIVVPERNAPVPTEETHPQGYPRGIMDPGYPVPPPRPIGTPLVPHQSNDQWSPHVQFQQQMAARQVVPKELPVFTGNPEDWPLFVSSYRNSTDMCGYSNAENLMRLQRCLKGSAMEAVRSNLLLPSSVPQVMDTLETLFGGPERLIQSLLNKVRKAPPPKADKLETLINFGLVVQNLVGHLRAANQQAHLTNPSLLHELVEKLPAHIRLDWAMFKRRAGRVDLGTFCDYMSSLISAACDVTTFYPDQSRPGWNDKANSREKAFINTHSQDSASKKVDSGKQTKNQDKPCFVCQSTSHRVRDCAKFKSQSLADRWKVVEANQMCSRCLVTHGRWPCKSTRLCDVKGCKQNHNPLLHPGQPRVDDKVDTNQKSPTVVSVHQQIQSKMLFRIVPIVLHGKRGQIETFAFLDEGSSITLVDKNLADQLGADGEMQPLCLTWTANVTRQEVDSRRVNLKVSGLGGGKCFPLSNVRTVESLDLPVQTMCYEDISKRFPHLQGLPIRSYQDAVPQLLIGLDNLRLAIPLKRREGRANEPVAANTRLGWTVFGSTDESAITTSSPMFHICTCTEGTRLHDLVKGFFAVDNLGVSASPMPESEDVKRAKEILQQTTVRLEDGRFEVALLWRKDGVEFPNSYLMAERRLRCLERRLDSQPELRIKVEALIEEFQVKGYAHKATRQELEEADPKQTWYLPIGVVINPRKPGKVRIIWDAAAEVNGVSFNSMLLKGPDLLTALNAVLCRFRQRCVAVVGDIREMFMQLSMRRKDRQAQMFIFRKDKSMPPEVYIMDVAIFGSTCSPCSAHYVKNKNAEEWSQQFPEAATAIVKNHYVDDYLDSRDTEEEVIKLATEVKTVHAKAKFEIRNWMSNSKEVLRRIGVDSSEAQKDFSVDKLNQTERVLGMTWIPDDDVFMFSLMLPADLQRLIFGEAAPTKRTILRLVMSLFDPLGLISHLLIHGKIIIQELWRSGVGWDDAVPKSILILWDKWIGKLQGLGELRIPRCYFPGYDPDSYRSLEIHVFVDASLAAFACAGYFRIVDRGQARCILVASKAKVASLKPLSIPRLELQAAVMGVRLLKSIEQNHTLRAVRRFIWSDSSTVLSWIRSDARRYRQYVAVRVGEILEEASIDEWKFVPGKQNIADDATKWNNGPDLKSTAHWFNAPEFLSQPKELWPTEKMQDPVEIPEELRPIHVHREVIRSGIVDCTRFSKWERLQRSMAYVFHFIDNCRKVKDQTQFREEAVLVQEDFEHAEQVLWREAQADEYADEIFELKKHKAAPNATATKFDASSTLRNLSPFLDSSGVIRMAGRIETSPYASYDAKYPIILPKNHYITKLIIDWYHRMYGHQNAETVVNEMRQRFHISGLRSAVKNVSKRCRWCAIRKVKPQIPRMAALPEERVTPCVRPFTHVGIDYFGPFMIKIGRKQVKRWVALFTCLTVRAVHLEPVSSMTTESCKLAIRRFIARRGAPLQIFTDNGTNFVGASRELADQIRAVNSGLSDTYTNANTKWHFIPPASPHMGGAWERMVRSVKSAMGALNQSRTPSEEVFHTVLCEAESMINSRPLTYIPLESSHEEALSPNHFILLSSSGVKQPERTPTDAGGSLRSGWKQCQYMLDRFWTRWVREYLPTITRRTKWFAEVRPVKEGDVVVIVDEGVRNRWTRGIILKAIPGKDGRIRQAEVKTATGVLRRPVAKIAVLDVVDPGKAADPEQLYGPGNVAAGVTASAVSSHGSDGHSDQ